jgi:twitching motility protein PilT
MTMPDLLREAVERRASDLHITVGVPPVFRIYGRLVRAAQPSLQPDDTNQLYREITDADQQKRFEEKGELDLSFVVRGLSRFRVNVFKQRGSIAIVCRMIAEHVPTLDELHFPEVIKQLARKPRGLVLVTGPTGSGKSTTLASMVNQINSEKDGHIITVEDPIEFLHQHDRSIVNQREIHADSQSFAAALRAALREDPDVIMVGEMRDIETIATAITAAETGHLVFATLHTNDSAQTIDRIIDAFPPHQQQQIRMQLSLNLQGIISQQLIPRADGEGRVVALEILLATPAVRNLIREGKTHQITSILQTNAKQGMRCMDFSLKDLYTRGVISYEDAVSHSIDVDQFTHLLGR